MASLSRISSAMSPCNPSSVCVPLMCFTTKKTKQGRLTASPEEVVLETPKEFNRL